MTESAVRLVAKMYEYRDTAKFILGDRFPAFCAEIGGIIDDIKKAKPDESEISIGMKLAQIPENTPQRTICIIGALVEKMEPSRPTSPKKRTEGR